MDLQVQKTSRIQNNQNSENIKMDNSTIDSESTLSNKPGYKNGDEKSLFQYRYIVTLLQFSAFVQINIYILASSISVVAMVDSSAVESHSLSNTTVDSCPKNSTVTDGYNATSEVVGEFDWSPSVQGNILGAGYLGFVITQMLGGVLAEAYGAKRTIIGGLFVSSLAHVLSPVAARSSSDLMIATHVIRGFGQGLIPAAHCVVAANWFPTVERCFLNSLVMSGYVVGALIGAFSAGSMCMSSFLGGWPSVFYLYGGLGLLHCLCFQVFLHETPQNHPKITDSELKYILQNQDTDLSQKRPPTPWRKILTSVPVYAVTYAIFGAFWVATHFLSVHPLFLGTILHFTPEENGIYTAIPQAVQLLLTYVGGWTSKILETRRYVGVNKLRKGFNLIFCVGYSLGLIGIMYAGCDRLWSNLLAILAMGFSALNFCGCMTAVIDMAPNFAGTVMGLSSTLASTSSYIFPVLVGYMTNEEQTLEQWDRIFWICIAVVMSSGLVFCVFGTAEIQPWNDPSVTKDNKIDSRQGTAMERLDTS